MEGKCGLIFSLVAMSYILGGIQGINLRELNDFTSVMLNRNSFPDGFIFGFGSSAYQYEGATEVDGRKPSIWDTFVRQYPEKILDRSTGAFGNEFYYNYKEDIALMKEIGLDSFRFSISWPRILPQGKISGGVNEEGVNFYNFLIDNLRSNGIQPFVTLFHWDLPQALEDEYGGFLSPNIVNDFRDYAGFCFEAFGDRVKHWATLNEPNLFSCDGYANGEQPPGRCSDYAGNCTVGNSATEPYIVTHNLILSHAAAVNLYRKKYQTDSGWIYIYPQGMRDLLLYVKKKYNHPPIYITENGLGNKNNNSIPVVDALNDCLRVQYFSLHLHYLLQAIKDGVDVRGYYGWSFLDDFEWQFGYVYRYGITYVDFKNGFKRYLKSSASWFKNFLRKESVTTFSSVLYSDH